MIDAYNLTAVLGGKWHGDYGTAPCPICQPEAYKDQTALTISNGRKGLITHCKKSDCAFTDVIKTIGLGAVDTSSSLNRSPDTKPRTNAKPTPAIAQKIWNESRPIMGTVAETYLRDSRKITAPLPETLRFHPSAWNGEERRHMPAMIAIIEGADGFGIHRTFLNSKGQKHLGKKMLGKSAGGAVRLSDREAPCLAVAEGIETALSPASGLLKRSASIWAALSASNMRNLNLPERPGHLVIALDADKAGIDAANALAERASRLCWTVELMSPPVGTDWNDVLREAPD